VWFVIKNPFACLSFRALEEKRARLGLVECVNHDLLQPYPVLHEKPGKSLDQLCLQIVKSTNSEFVLASLL
jgi:hypothetical protein